MVSPATNRSTQRQPANVTYLDQAFKERPVLSRVGRIEFRVRFDYMNRTRDVYDSHRRAGRYSAGFGTFLQEVFEDGLKAATPDVTESAYKKLDEYAGKLSKSIAIQIQSEENSTSFNSLRTSIEKTLDERTAATVIFYIGLERMPHAPASDSGTTVLPGPSSSKGGAGMTPTKSETNRPRLLVKATEPQGDEDTQLPSSDRIARLGKPLEPQEAIQRLNELLAFTKGKLANLKRAS